jgi:hypothetical protein
VICRTKADAAGSKKMARAATGHATTPARHVGASGWRCDNQITSFTDRHGDAAFIAREAEVDATWPGLPPSAPRN